MIETSRHEQQEKRAARTKVLLANGHRLFRSGLREMLSSTGEDIEVLEEEAQNDEEAIKPTSEMEPDVVVLDVVQPSAEEHKTIDQMLQASPKSGLVLVYMERNPSSRFAWQLLTRGVSAQLDPDTSAEGLVGRGTRRALRVAGETRS
jgi:DNA-binding NarL/FixJ family response regulator